MRDICTHYHDRWLTFSADLGLHAGTLSQLESTCGVCGFISRDDPKIHAGFLYTTFN